MGKSVRQLRNPSEEFQKSISRWENEGGAQVPPSKVSTCGTEILIKVDLAHIAPVGIVGLCGVSAHRSKTKIGQTYESDSFIIGTRRLLQHVGLWWFMFQANMITSRMQRFLVSSCCQWICSRAFKLFGGSSMYFAWNIFPCCTLKYRERGIAAPFGKKFWHVQQRFGAIVMAGLFHF